MMRSIDQWWCPAPIGLLDLPEKARRKILNYAFADDGRHRIEERACNCISNNYPDKTFPFRQEQAMYKHDTETQNDVVRSESECPKDQKHVGLKLWCVKQYLAHPPGKKRTIPALATTCKRLYKDWRDITVWVFCTEKCLARAIRVLPYDNTYLMTHVRIFERSNRMDLPDEEGQWGPRGEACVDGSGRVVRYEVGENVEVEYKGRKVWVKEMRLGVDDV